MVRSRNFVAIPSIVYGLTRKILAVKIERKRRRSIVVRKFLKYTGRILAVLLVLVIVYIAYVVLSYHRIEDHLTLMPDTPISEQTAKRQIDSNEKKEFVIATANLGFGAYDQEFDFFMDGGKKSWAKNAERVKQNITASARALLEIHPDFLLFQEVDTDGTRSHHINEYNILKEQYPSFTSVFAKNYDSAFLFWPIYQPHGKNQAGLATVSSYDISKAERRSLPISDSMKKFLDLDRCYSISKIPGKYGRDLVLINVHLSAYGVDEDILKAQRDMLYADMKKEYENGNYVIAGGDFNHDLIGNSGEQYGNQVTTVESWAKPFDFDSIPEGFTLGSKAVMDAGRFDMAATCRDTSRPYDGTNDRWLLDGFIYSDNIEMLEYDTVDLDFAYSDHNPVQMKFRLLLD